MKFSKQILPFAGALLLSVLLSVNPASATIVVDGDPAFQEAVEDCLNKISQSGGAAGDNLDNLMSSGNTHSISQGAGNSNTASNGANASNGTGTGSSTKWSPTKTGKYNNDTTERDPCASLAHELSHAADADAGTRDPSPGHNGIKKNEIKASGVENEYRANQTPPLPKRNKYCGSSLP